MMKHILRPEARGAQPLDLNLRLPLREVTTWGQFLPALERGAYMFLELPSLVMNGDHLYITPYNSPPADNCEGKGLYGLSLNYN